MSELALRSQDPAFVRMSPRDNPSPGSLWIAFVGAALLLIAAFAGLLQAAVLAPFMMLALLFPSPRRPLSHTLRALLAEGGRARARRERSRRRRLRRAGPLFRGKYDELRYRVDEIARVSPPITQQLELEDLLEHYVRLALSYDQYLRAIPVWTDAEPRWRFAAEGSAPRRLRNEIVARRLEHRNACWRRLDALVDELDAIDEFVGWVEQRLACPDADLELDDALTWRCAELDAIEAALHELSPPAEASAPDHAAAEPARLGCSAT